MFMILQIRITKLPLVGVHECPPQTLSSSSANHEISTTTSIYRLIGITGLSHDEGHEAVHKRGISAIGPARQRFPRIGLYAVINGLFERPDWIERTVRDRSKVNFWENFNVKAVTYLYSVFMVVHHLLALMVYIHSQEFPVYKASLCYRFQGCIAYQ
jgi:hypothetical protein